MIDNNSLKWSLSSVVAKKNKLPTFLEGGLYLFLFSVPFHSVLIFPGVSVVKAIGLILAPIWFIWVAIRLRDSHWRWIMPRQNLYIIYFLVAFIISILISAFYNSISPIFHKSLMTIILRNAMVIIIYSLVLSEVIIRSYIAESTCQPIFGWNNTWNFSNYAICDA
jgi:hypothetical protein